MSIELVRINRWIYSTLSGDATVNAAVDGRIYSDEAPQGAAVPMVVFAYLGGAERLQPFGGGRFTTSLYLIRAIAGGGSLESAATVADRIDTLMTVPSGGTIVDGVRVTYCWREQPHQRKDSENGKPVIYLGGFYRILFQPST